MVSPHRPAVEGEREYGGLRIERAERLKEMGKVNARMKKLVHYPSLDKAILKEAAKGNFVA